MAHSPNIILAKCSCYNSTLTAEAPDPALAAPLGGAFVFLPLAGADLGVVNLVLEGGVGLGFLGCEYE